MSAQFSRPVRRPAEMFDRLFAGLDPAEVSRAAHATASALVARAREHGDDETVERLVRFTDEHGIDDIAALWSPSPAASLPGSLWRLYLVQRSIHDDSDTASLLYERGRAEVHSADAVIAGATTPAGPADIVRLVDAILRGAFTGDFAIALERAAAFCRVEATGAAHLADDYETTEPERASTLTTRALRLSTFAADLQTAARLWRRENLD